MPHERCAETEDGVHVPSREHARAEVGSLGALDVVGIAVTCAACGLHAGWIVDVPLELTWRAEPPSLPAAVRRAPRVAPKLTIIAGGKPDG